MLQSSEKKSLIQWTVIWNLHSNQIFREQNPRQSKKTFSRSAKVHAGVWSLTEQYLGAQGRNTSLGKHEPVLAAEVIHFLPLVTAGSLWASFPYHGFHCSYSNIWIQSRWTKHAGTSPSRNHQLWCWDTMQSSKLTRTPMTARDQVTETWLPDLRGSIATSPGDVDRLQ